MGTNETIFRIIFERVWNTGDVSDENNLSQRLTPFAAIPVTRGMDKH